MIPTKTLRERMTEAILDKAIDLGLPCNEASLIGSQIPLLVEAAIQAIGDPCLIKTADSLEPTFTLRAQDKLAPPLIRQWASLAGRLGCDLDKVSEADTCAAAMDDWPNRKWPD